MSTMSTGFRRWSTVVAAITLLAVIAGWTQLPAQQPSSPGPAGQPAGQKEQAPFSGGMLTPTTGKPNEQDPEVYADPKGHAYRVWIEERTGPPGYDKKGVGGVVQFTRSSDGGLTWTAPVTIPDRNDDGQAINPKLVFDAQGHVFGVWRTKLRATRDRLIRFQRSADFGATWAPESQVLNEDAAGFDPIIELGTGGRLYVVWSDERSRNKPRNFDVFFRRSTDLGTTWDPETRLNPVATTAGPASTAIINHRPRLVEGPDGHLAVIWIGTGSGRSSIYLRRSQDAGQTWQDPVDIGQGGSSTWSNALFRGADGALLAVWQVSQGGPIAPYVSRSEDGGRSWLPPLRIAHLPEGRTSHAAFPAAALGPKGELYVAWQEARHGREDIYLNRSVDGGRTWLAQDIRVNQTDPGTAVSQLPQVAVNGAGTVAVAWEDDRRGFPGIFLAVSFDGGQAWREVRVDQDTPPRTGARGARLAWGPGDVLHVAWHVEKRLSASEVETSVRYRRLVISRP